MRSTLDTEKKVHRILSNQGKSSLPSHKRLMTSDRQYHFLESHISSPAPNAYDLPTKSHTREARAYSFGYKSPPPSVIEVPGPGSYHPHILSAAIKGSFSKSHRFPQLLPSFLHSCDLEEREAPLASKFNSTFSKASRCNSNLRKDQNPGPGNYAMAPEKLFQQFNRSTKISPPQKTALKIIENSQDCTYNVIRAYNYLFAEGHRSGKFSQGKRFNDASNSTLNCAFLPPTQNPRGACGGAFDRTKRDSEKISLNTLGPGAYSPHIPKAKYCYTFGFRRKARTFYGTKCQFSHGLDSSEIERRFSDGNISNQPDAASRITTNKENDPNLN